jgi:hypothetical protein
LPKTGATEEEHYVNYFTSTKKTFQTPVLGGWRRGLEAMGSVWDLWLHQAFTTRALNNSGRTLPLWAFISQENQAAVGNGYPDIEILLGVLIFIYKNGTAVTQVNDGE